MRIVRRYKNRKLYDTGTKQYITLVDLLKVARTEDVRVTEAPSGKDLTAYALALGIAQEAKENPSEDLVGELTQFVRRTHQPVPAPATTVANGSAHTAR